MHRPPQVMPWGFPDPLKPLKNQDKAAFKLHLLEHNASLDINSPRSPHTLLSIICTIGESSLATATLGQMVEFGMKAVRLDMSVGTSTDHILMIRKVKNSVQDISAKLKRPVPIATIGDIKGPQIVTGKLLDTDKVSLKRGQTITLTTHQGWKEKGSADKVYVDYHNLSYILKPKDRVFLDFGRIELVVRGTATIMLTVDSDIVCVVQNDGELGNHKLVTVLNVPIDMDPITDKDKKDISLLVDEKVDAVFASAVTSGPAVEEIRKALGEKGKGILVFSKIESSVAYENLNEILEASDGIVINRGKLGIELSTERVMLVQKSTIARAMKVGKPVFVLTEYLNSMVHLDCPTIAESTDVVTAVVDGVDGIIMADETAVGDDPVMVVRTLQTLAKEAESQIWQWELFHSLDALTLPPLDPAHAVCIAAVTAATKCHAAAILVVTTSGRSAQVVAKYRPRCPILAVTRYGGVFRQLTLWRGIFPIHYLAVPDKCYSREVDLRLQYAIETGKQRGMIAAGDPLVLLNGWRQGAGFTNNIRVVYASLEDPWINPHSPAATRPTHKLTIKDDF